MKRTPLSRLVITGALLLLSACRAIGDNATALDTAQLCATTDSGIHPITAELAVTSSQRSQGLMGRESMGENQGMLFVYQEPRSPDANFWMYRTFIPLDIAYLGKDGEIRAIRKMAPCAAEDANQCPRYKAGVPYQLALEMQQGFFKQRDIGVGDYIMRVAENGACNLPPVSGL